MSQNFTNRSDIHWGDLTLALHDLPYKNKTQAKKIAAALGFTLSDQKNKVQKPRTLPSNPKTAKKAAQPLPTRKPQPSVPPAPSPPIKLPEGNLPGLLDSLSDLPPPADDMPQPDQQFERYDEKNYGPMPQASLIHENTSRGILTALLQTQRISNRIDIRRLIRQSVNGFPPKRLPYLQTGTLEHGCQVLLDYADSMVPWWDDLHALSAQLEKILSTEQNLVYQFNDYPLEAKSWIGDPEPTNWQPIAQTPVLVATDFGLPNASSAYRLELRWREFISCCEQGASPLIFLIPWEYDSFLEKVLGPYPYLFQWSPKTTASQIKSLIGAGHQIKV